MGNYIQQFQALAHQTGYGEPELLQRFLKGLNSNLQQDLFLMRSDQNMNDTVNAVQRLDALKQGNPNPYGNPRRSNQQYVNNNGNTQYVPMELDATKVAATITCYSCGKKGHYKRNCRSKHLWSSNARGRGRGRGILYNPRRIRATDIQEEQPDLHQQLAAQQDAMDTMFKLIKGISQEKSPNNVMKVTFTTIFHPFFLTYRYPYRYFLCHHVT